MTEPHDKTGPMAEVDEIYQALGQFFVQFSHMVHAMETDLFFIVGGNQQLLHAITAELTADPLARAWRSVITQTTDLTDDEIRILSVLHTEITRPITLRNDWAHGTWFVGFGDEVGWPKAVLTRFKNSAKGLAAPSTLEGLPTAEYIRSVATHTDFIANGIFNYGVNVMLLRDRQTTTRPSDRFRVISVDGRKHLEMTADGVNWKSSKMP
jgi:hypothetical protein